MYTCLNSLSSPYTSPLLSTSRRLQHLAAALARFAFCKTDDALEEAATRLAKLAPADAADAADAAADSKDGSA